MLDNSLAGKRLLLIGGIAPMTDLIELARRNGVFIGVADYNRGTKVKQIADAAYEIDALDVDALAERLKLRRELVHMFHIRWNSCACQRIKNILKKHV